MRKLLLIVIVAMATLADAQTQLPQARPWSNFCDSTMKILDMPYHYCMCKEFSNEFSFPLEAEISDTVWYTATINDLRQGICAYWFSSVPVTMEVFAFCASKVPTFSLTVGGNQMREVDAKMIDDQLNELSKQEQLMVETFKPHMRVYPHNGGTGRVYCYPYGQGPESTCADPMPLRAGMTYICEKEKNVYRMEWSSIAASGKSFVLWKQEKNKPCEIRLTLDSCTGEEIGRAVLSDSLHVYQPDSAAIVSARNNKRSIWLHVEHEKGYTGRIYCYNNPKYTEQRLLPLKNKVCQGKTLTANFRTYDHDTTFTDTLWVTRDTLNTQDISFTFTQPTMEYDTVHVSAADLARGYRYPSTTVVFYTYTDSTIVIKKNNACTRVVHVTVMSNGEGVDYIGSNDAHRCKYIRNGQLFILVDDRKYNVLGQQIKADN